MLFRLIVKHLYVVYVAGTLSPCTCCLCYCQILYVVYVALNLLYDSLTLCSLIVCWNICMLLSYCMLFMLH